MISEKKIFLRFSHCKYMGAHGPWGVATLDSRGLTGRIYIVDHYTFLHTRYVSCGPHGFKDYIFSFFHCKSMGANEHQGMASSDPRGLIGRIYVGDH